jgi:hypothetical protein
MSDPQNNQGAENSAQSSSLDATSLPSSYKERLEILACLEQGVPAAREFLEKNAKSKEIVNRLLAQGPSIDPTSMTILTDVLQELKNSKQEVERATELLELYDSQKKIVATLKEATEADRNSVQNSSLGDKMAALLNDPNPSEKDPSTWVPVREEVSQTAKEFVQNLKENVQSSSLGDKIASFVVNPNPAGSNSSTWCDARDQVKVDLAQAFLGSLFGKK